jgi:CubicO group peptidase (beta-lactamase class C family)
MRKLVKPAVLLIGIACLFLPAETTVCEPQTAQSENAPGFQQRLERLIEQLEKKRQEFHIPGMAVAVVKDDKVVLSEGLGWADLEKRKPVTPKTIFAIGSCGKAFTTTLIGMLVDDGMIHWDDPVTRYLPYFRMKLESEKPDATVTIRDLLLHRTGFSRMNMVWLESGLSREEILRKATKAEPRSEFRSQYLYNNVMYMAAGVAAGKAASSDWDTLIRERIFKPLGMTSSSTSIKTLPARKAAKGYIWDDILEKNFIISMSNLDNVGPAGSINSNILDMAKWIRFHLNRGSFEGVRLINEMTHKETWARQMKMGGGLSYGLGWILNRWKGKSEVAHGGNVDGFSARVAMLPENNIGFVLLTNQTSSALTEVVQSMAWETLLGEWIEPLSEEQKRQYGPLLGTYIANFGNYKDAKFEVKVKDGSVVLEAPGSRAFVLKNSASDRKWLFAESPQVSVSFERDSQGKVILMKLYQGAYTFELPRMGEEIAPEIPLEQLKEHLGKYYGERLKETLELLIQNNHLALDIPGQMVYELHPPDTEGRWYFRLSKRAYLTFAEPDSESGKIPSFTYHEGEAHLRYERIEEDTKKLPGEGKKTQMFSSVEDILALRKTEERKAALQKLGLFRMTGSAQMFQSAVKGKLTWYVDGIERHYQSQDYGRFGQISVAVDGLKGQRKTPYLPMIGLRGKYLEQARLAHPGAVFGDWRDFYSSIQFLHPDEWNDKKVFILQMSGREVPPVRAVVDAQTGDLLQSQTSILRFGSSLRLPETIVYEDYRDVHGLRIPFRIVTNSNYSGRTVLEIEYIETNLKRQDTHFQIPGIPINKEK